MKPFSILMALAIFVVSACMVYLLTKGVSIRPETLIKPTQYAGLKHLSEAVTARLFVEFEKHPIVVFGLSPSKTNRRLVVELKKAYDRMTGKSARIVSAGYDFSSCKDSCWILLPQQAAHHLTDSSLYDALELPETPRHMSITMVPFKRTNVMSLECENAQRLNFQCLQETVISHSYRKMKSGDYLYFFVKKYMAKDIFIFVEEPS